jgi:hypothetical protein
VDKSEIRKGPPKQLRDQCSSIYRKRRAERINDKYISQNVSKYQKCNYNSTIRTPIEVKRQSGYFPLAVGVNVSLQREFCEA